MKLETFISTISFGLDKFIKIFSDPLVATRVIFINMEFGHLSPEDLDIITFKLPPDPLENAAY